MTDTNPLAPIEALVIREERRVWQSMMPLTSLAWVTVRELRDALAEAREEVEGLVAERDAAREALDHNVARIEDMLATLSMVADRLDEFTYDELRSVLDDDPLDQWGEIYKSRLTEAREALARVEALAGTTIEGEVDGKPTPVPLIWASDLRAALTQPATDEETE